jgi:hypothetical protein
MVHGAWHLRFLVVVVVCTFVVHTKTTKVLNTGPSSFTRKQSRCMPTRTSVAARSSEGQKLPITV